LLFSIEIRVPQLHVKEAWFARKELMMLVVSDRVHQVSIVLVQTSQEYLVLQGIIVQREETLTLLNALEEPSTCILARRTARYVLLEESALSKV